MSSRYERAVDILFTLVDYSKISHNTIHSDSFQLERLKKVLDSLENPQKSFPVIHIAGTKGKGSTALLMTAALQGAGYKTGLYTSPYLFDVREQIRIGEKIISKGDFSALVERIKPFLLRDETITYFEAVTALAFLYFKDAEVDVAIVETGLGGLVDATNVVEPILSMITSISYDHTQIIGDTIASIASHKAGIIKAGHPVVIGKQAFPQATEIIKEKARLVNSEFISTEETINLHSITHTLSGQVFKINLNDENRSKSWNGVYQLALLGKHQTENAALALTGLMKLTDLGFILKPIDISKSWEKIRFPCRFEVIQMKPPIILDGAHNVDSMVRLREAIEEYLKGFKIVFVFGASLDKDIIGMLKEIGPLAQKTIFAASGHPRASEPAMLVELGRQLDLNVEKAKDVSSALKAAAVISENNGSATIVTGSLHIAAMARGILLENKQEDE